MSKGKCDYLKEANQFRPDWTQTWNIKEAERELKGFKFNGIGWYLTKDDTLLIIPAFSQDDIDYFEFLVYNNRNPIKAFNQIANAPTRLNERI
jgi:glutamine cyclotransferase